MKQTANWLIGCITDLKKRTQGYSDSVWVEVKTTEIEITILLGYDHRPDQKSSFVYPEGISKMDVLEALENNLNGVKDVFLMPKTWRYTVPLCNTVPL